MFSHNFSFLGKYVFSLSLLLYSEQTKNKKNRYAHPLTYLRQRFAQSQLCNSQITALHLHKVGKQCSINWPANITKLLKLLGILFSQSTWKIESTNLRAFACSNSAVETPKQGVKFNKVNKSNRRQCRRSGVFIANFEHISKNFQFFQAKVYWGVFIICFFSTLTRYFSFSLEKGNYFYRNRLSYLFLFSLLKERSCVLHIILTTRYYVAFSIQPVRFL